MMAATAVTYCLTSQSCAFWSFCSLGQQCQSECRNPWHSWPGRNMWSACFTYIITCYTQTRHYSVTLGWDGQQWSPNTRCEKVAQGAKKPVRTEDWGVIDTKLFSPPPSFPSFHFTIDWGQLTIIFSQSLVRLRPGLQTCILNYFSNWWVCWKLFPILAIMDL